MRTLSLRLLVALISLLPGRARRAPMRWLAGLRYRRYRAGIRPQAANLRARLGVTPAEAERLLRRSFELELAAILDGLRLRSLTADNMASLVEIRGLRWLDDALTQGQGAVLTSGHVEGLPACFGALGVLGYRPNIVRLRARDRKRRIAKWIYGRYTTRIERCGCTTLWMEPGGFGVGVRALNALRRNEIVVSPIDLSQSSDNAIVEFFGSPASFPRGLAALAKASGAPILDIFAYRTSEGTLIAEIGEPHAVVDVDESVQHSAACLEAHIRRHPADWCPWHVFDQWAKILQAPPAGDAAARTPSVVDDERHPSRR